MSVSTKPPQDSEPRAAPTRAAGSVPLGAAESADGSAAVVVRDAGKRFDDVWVTRHLTFQVEQGSIFGLFGPSGSGKTTAIRLLLGLLSLDEGEVRVLGAPLKSFRSRIRERIGYMPQLFVLYPELTVMENLHLAASMYGLSWFGRRRTMREVLEFVELWEHRGKKSSNLSGGMKRRLQLATALVHNPELIVMDEPTAGIDPILRAKLWDRFRAFREEGKTVFVTSQYVTEAEYCDHVAVLGKGEIVAVGSPEQIREAAMGGEIVDIVAEGLDRRLVERLASLKGVRGVRRLSYEQLQLTVDQAASSIPLVLSTLQDGGAETTQVQPYRPNFDEVFVRLMERTNVESVE